MFTDYDIFIEKEFIYLSMNAIRHWIVIETIILFLEQEMKTEKYNTNLY